MVLQRTAKGHKTVPYSHSAERLRKVFRDIGLRQGWWDTRLSLVLAVSGGVDSMALLWLFRSLWKGRVAIAHLNHGIRGTSADRDQAFVGMIAETCGLSLVTERIEVPSNLLKGESLEDGARRIRYSFLEKAMQSTGALGVALAHTSDDSVETFLLNLLRGTGPRGLSGIPEQRGPFFRPVLSFSKVFLRGLLQYHCIPWREDLSNLDDQYTRNRVRNRLLPMLRDEFNPRVKEAIMGVADEMKGFRLDEERLQSILTPLLHRRVPFASYSCSLEGLRALDEREMRVFFRGIAARLGLRTLARDRTESLCGLVRRSGGWCFQWQKDMFLLCSSRLVAWIHPDILSSNSENEPAVHALEGSEGRFSWGKWRFTWNKEPAPGCVYGTMGAYFPSLERLEVLPISKVREIPGDGSVPEWARPLYPVMCSGGHCWVPFWGGRRADTHLPGGVRISATFEGDLQNEEKKVVS